MGRGSTTLLLAFALAGLATAAAVMLREAPPPPSPSPSTPVAPPPTGPGADAPPTQEPATQGPTIGLPATAPRVWIAMETLGTYAAPRPLGVVVRRGEAVVPARVEAIAGADGGRAGRALLRIEADGRLLHRVAQLPGGDGEAVVEIGPPTTLRGKVLDAARQPLAGARVWVGGAPDDELETGADGAFAADVAGGAGVPVVVRASGAAWASRIVDAVPGVGPLEFALAPACELTVRLNGGEVAARGATVAVVPSGASFSTELLQYPFFAQGLLVQWPLDEQGRAVVTGLPRDVVVGVQIAGPLLPTTVPLAVELRRATATADVTAPPQAAALARGVVVDERGDPLAGALVVCGAHGREPSPGAERWLLPAACGRGGASWTITGDDGAFELAPPATKGCELAVAAAGRATLVRPLAGENGRARCPLPPWPDGPAQLLVPAPGPAVAWGVRVEPPDREFTAVAADRAFARALPSPVLATLRVRCCGSGGDWSAPRVAAEVALLGDWELPAALLAR